MSSEDTLYITEIDLAVMRVAGELYAARRGQNPHLSEEGKLTAITESVEESVMLLHETLKRWRDIRKIAFEEPETAGDNDNVGRFSTF